MSHDVNQQNSSRTFSAAHILWQFWLSRFLAIKNSAANSAMAKRSIHDDYNKELEIHRQIRIDDEHQSKMAKRVRYRYYEKR